MAKCITCKHFENKNFEQNCNELLNNIEVEIEVGWNGGYVKSISIDEPEKFCCIKYQKKENNHG